ncbi:MAG TPA: thioredoxin domain-containing protein [Ornithinimicrobium sp.]|uniref:DsbA family protein n=1 Tax=Ornithinimicrobium sp. TaxID=1977084 RepID=UPI002B49764C|nr:thioredoxin domain-containing protein [Ornithinimicrobium sp.]HKJ11854.1 thioredoxin domain-containing protein [Ornithinimicrobium sp.]
MGLIGAVTAVLVAIVAVVVYLASRGDGLDAAGGANALAEGGGLVVNPDAGNVPEVIVYEDFQCPFCGQLEQTSGPQIVEAAQEGDIKLTYIFMSFLDGASGNQSSSRAANAAVCSADAGVLPDFVLEVFEDQPQEGVGYEDEAFLEAAESAGVEGEQLEQFTTCVQEQEYQGYVQDMAERSSQDGVTSTPTITVDGEALGQQQMQQLLSDPSAFDSVLAESQ